MTQFPGGFWKKEEKPGIFTGINQSPMATQKNRRQG
jgi:hypothetical protein